MRKLLLILQLFILSAGYAQTPAFIQQDIDSYITKGLKDWDIPGLAIVIVKDGKVVLNKGYGVKNIQTGEPVDSNTLFMIASNSKLFTGIAMAQLEYNRKLSLDDKITRYFKDYRLYDSLTTQMVTIRDMLTHRIGTKTFQGDFTFWNSKLTRKEVMYRMRYLKPVGTFRQDYGYCNSCYLTAGEIIPIVTGKPWEVYVYDSLILPAGMNNTHTLSRGIAQRSNAATPYTTSFTGKLNEVPYDDWGNLAPAASIISNVNDLSKWLMLQLDSGKINGKQVVPWPALQKTRDVQIVTGSRKSALYPMHFRGYGLGVFAADYNGRQVYWHTGGAAGMVSNVCFVPEERLGIAILTNNDNQGFFEALRYQVLDAYLNVPYVNRSEQQLLPFKKEQSVELAQIQQWKDSVASADISKINFNAYAGEYAHQLYGTLTVTVKEKTLRVVFNSHHHLSASMQYMGNNRWLLEYDNVEYGKFPVWFNVEQNKIVAVNIKANDFVEMDMYQFIRQKK